MVTKSIALEKVHAIKALMIAVSTGLRRIEEAESEYLELRGQVAASLREFRIADPNGFQSLWDWFNYWKERQMGTYRARRAYIASLFNPVIESLEAALVAVPDDLSQRADQSFSARYGYASVDLQPEITIREDLPLEVRNTIVGIMTQHWNPDDLLYSAARIGKQPWELAEHWHSRGSSMAQLRGLVSGWDWPLVFDFVERVLADMPNREVQDDGRQWVEFEEKVNGYFRHAGVGWQLQGGKFASRGSESFEVAVRCAIPELETGGLQTARREIHEALADLSRRPHADLTGAIHHAMGALECVARAATGDSRGTLGEILKRHPDLIPKPLDAAVDKAWGYASERARHMREGNDPTRDEAELIVGIAATVATFLAKKKII
ncbi:MAG: hypothetical protein NTZ56_07910 [Acidobacteria bacterium]|nr:hypothetical protein [Acidobacteriota bacterium]